MKSYLQIFLTPHFYYHNFRQDGPHLSSPQPKMRDNKLVLNVLDEGPCIKQSDINNIFDKFYHTPDNKADGTRLGLSIVAGFVRAHGYTVSAKTATKVAQNLKL